MAGGRELDVGQGPAPQARALWRSDRECESNEAMDDDDDATNSITFWKTLDSRSRNSFGFGWVALQ
jgi:hypothetical protein